MCARDYFRGIQPNVSGRRWLPGCMVLLYLLAISPFALTQTFQPQSLDGTEGEVAEVDVAEAPATPKPGDDSSKKSEKKDDGAEISEFLKLSKSLEAKLVELRKKDAKRAEMLETSLLNILKQYQRSADGGGPTTAAPEQHAASPQFRPRFAEAKLELARLRAIGAEDLANVLANRLATIEHSLETRAYDFARSDEPEVHMVTLQQGTTLPARYRTQENRFRLGYAEVHLKYAARPITLLLKAQESILWNVVAAPGVRVHAVVFDSPQPQELVGLDHPLVLDTKSAMQKGHLNQYSRYGRVSSYGVALAGDDPVTNHADAIYPGKPIVIGGESEQWLSAFMVPVVESLIAESRTEWRQRKLRELSDLRFKATYVSRPPNQNFGPMVNSSVGEFSVVGPIAETLVPMRHPSLRQSIVIPSDTEHLEFGLDLSGQLVSLSSKEIPDRLTPVPPSSTLMRQGNRFRALTYDALRSRLVLSTSYGQASDILAFDVKKAEWSNVATLPLPAFAMTYVPAEDSIWMLVSRRKNGPTEKAELWKMAHDGTIISKHEVSAPLGEEVAATNQHSYYGSMWDNSYPQLVESNGYAILVGLRQVRNPSLRNWPAPEIYVIEAKSGEMVYSGELRVIRGAALDHFVGESDSPLSPRRGSVSPEPAYGILAELNQKLARATRAIQELKETADGRASELERRLRFVCNMVRGNFEPRKDPRLYLVGIYRSAIGPVKVRVTDTSGPVVLALSGYQAIEWQVEVSEGVELTRIIAAGNAAQKVSAKPNGVKVSSLAGQEGFSVFDHRNAAAWDSAAKRLRELTDGMEVAAATVSHHATDQEIVVGPDEGPFRAQIAITELEQLIAQATADRTSRILAELEKKRFFAVHQGALPRHEVNRNNDNRYWCEFTIHGPIIGTGTQLEQNFQHWAHDRHSGRLFIATQNQLTIVDTKTDAQERVNLLQMDKRLGQVAGLGYDDKRERLIISSYNRVFAMDPELKKLLPLRAKNSYQEQGMAYSRVDDVFYAVSGDRSRPNEIRQVLRYNANGAMLPPLYLSKPFARGQQYSSSNLLQIIDLEEFVALVDYQSDRRFVMVNGRRVRRPPAGRIAIVELATGDVVYDGELHPRVERRDISLEQLGAMWQKLGATEVPELDRLLWDMASGDEGTLRFIRSKIQPVDVALDEVDIALLVKDLDDNRFSIRDRAFKKLQASGSSIEPALQKHIAGDVTSEVRERLQSLIRSWKSGEPQNDEERRRVRALEVLARMGTPDARGMLEEFDDPRFDAVTRRYAKKVLSGDTEQDSQEAARHFQKNLFVPRQR